MTPDQRIILSLGSNIEPRAHRLAAAIEAMHHDGAIRNIIVSPVYSTDPVGVTNQPVFLNCCLAGDTTLGPADVVRYVKDLEARLGRQHRQRWHEREIDIDVLLLGDVVYSSQQAEIPHPRLHERRFVLVPACDVAPDARHPLLQASIHQLCSICPDSSAVEVLGPLTI